MYAVRKCRRGWSDTGQIRQQWFTMRHRWVAVLLSDTFATLDALALIIALYAVIVGAGTT